jgi:hypothetical protein
MKYRVCPHCGVHLDFGEKCDCQNEKESAPAGTGTPSECDGSVPCIVTPSWPDVNDCLQLRDICRSTGAQGKEIAMVVREQFPKFNRQLLAQCQAPEKYGIVIHPDGLRLICDTYGVEHPEEPCSDLAEPSTETERSAGRKKDNRRLGRKLTFRMTPKDYAKLIVRVDRDGFESVQAWLYDKVMKMLEDEPDV